MSDLTSDFERDEVLQARYQWLFLLRTSEIAPEVLEDLRQSVLPEWQSLLRQLAETGARQLDADHASETRASIAGRPELSMEQETIAQSLQSWGKRHNLSDRWIIKTALSTLQHWNRIVPVRPNQPHRLEWKLPPVTYYSPLQAQPFTFEGWDPGSHPWKDYSQRLLEELKQYRIGVEKTLEGWKKPRKLELDHFDWLVRYQVLGLSYLKISRFHNLENDLDPESGKKRVKAGIRDKAERIDLTLRPGGKGGRPKKKTSN